MMITMLLLMMAAAPPTSARSTPDSDSQVCRERSSPGSRIPKQTCRTEAEWLAFDNEKRQRDRFWDDLRNRAYPVSKH